MLSETKIIVTKILDIIVKNGSLLEDLYISQHFIIYAALIYKRAKGTNQLQVPSYSPVAQSFFSVSSAFLLKKKWCDMFMSMFFLETKQNVSVNERGKLHEWRYKEWW